MDKLNQNINTQVAQEDFEDFFENSLCGYLTLNSEGKIVRANKRVAEWTQIDSSKLAGQKFSDFLPMGDKIFYETNLRPLLKIQGFFDQVSFQLKIAEGKHLHVFANAIEHRGDEYNASFTRITLINATDRGIYEQTLRDERNLSEKNLLSEQDTANLREQFIAVLGHDLRNPLGAIVGGIDILSRGDRNPREKSILATMGKSSERILEMIENVMDLARGRLGAGIQVEKTLTQMEPTLAQVVSELRSKHPDQIIISNFKLDEPVNCNAPRIAQILSNLLSNAVHHGAVNATIHINAETTDTLFSFSVINQGQTIPPASLEKIFQPFKRADENMTQEGLGLGL